MSTIFEVAQHAGVSHMTVSRYFNQPDKLSPATRVRVRKAVEALQFIPNASAQSLAKGSTRLLALIVTNIANNFCTSVASGVEEVVRAHGYTLILCNTEGAEESERVYLDMLISRRVDGLLLMPAPGSENHLDMLQQRKIPLVLVDLDVPGVDADFVYGDSFDGGLRLTRHLIAQGCRDIAFVGGQAGLSSLEQRLAGYRAAMAEAGLPERVYLQRYDLESGRAITKGLLEKEHLPEGLVAASNHVAAGALMTLREQGLRVPEDIAIASFDDIELASLIDPFLTAVVQPAREMGRKATELLIERIEGYKGPVRRHCFPVAFIERRSTQRAAAPPVPLDHDVPE